MNSSEYRPDAINRLYVSSVFQCLKLDWLWNDKQILWDFGSHLSFKFFYGNQLKKMAIIVFIKCFVLLSISSPMNASLASTLRLLRILVWLRYSFSSTEKENHHLRLNQWVSMMHFNQIHSTFSPFRCRNPCCMWAAYACTSPFSPCGFWIQILIHFCLSFIFLLI